MDAWAVGNRGRARCVIWRGRLASERLLLVVELDVWLVEQGHEKAEREVAGRGLREREAGVPAVQVPLEPNEVGAELPGVEIVIGRPGGRAMRRRVNREFETDNVPPTESADETRVDLGAGPCNGVE